MPPANKSPETKSSEPVSPVLTKPAKSANTRYVGVAIVVVLLGTLTGYLLSTQAISVSPESGSPSAVSSGKEIGIQDDKTFRDCAQGTLEANEADSEKTEGSHKLTREGGPSQTVYMISSALALDEYLGKKVEVCGETIKSKKVAWFMDVGKLKLLE